MTNGLNPEQIKLVKETVERVENLEAEKRGIAEDVKEIFAYAKEKGIDVKAVKTLIRKRKKSAKEIELEQDMVELYESALSEFEPIN